MEFHKPLFDRAKEKNLLPLTTVYDPKDLAFIEGLGCAAYKIASFELTFDDLLVEVAYTKKPIILSQAQPICQRWNMRSKFWDPQW